VLEDFGFSEPLIEQIKSFLNESSDGLHEQKLDPVGAHSFGTAPASLGCAGDASKAQAHVKKAIADMVVGLQRYVDALADMQVKVDDVETTVQADLTKQINRAQSCETPDFTTVGVCTANG
jgi:hypothetical protein